jgi:predicted dehydrogenase
MAKGHARAYLADPRAELVACSDIVDDVVNRFGDEFGIAGRYLGYREMLTQEKPDIVSICTHHPLHAPMTIDAARLARPKAILCEKPIALDLPSADEMIAICRETGTLLIIGHQRRFDRQTIAARCALEHMPIGDILFVEAFGHPRSSLLIDSTHTIDLVRYLIGDPVGSWVIGQIDARSHASGWGQRIEDCALAWIGMSNGVKFLLGAGSALQNDGVTRTIVSPHPIIGGTYHRIVIHGTTGRLELHGDRPNNGSPLVQIHSGSESRTFFTAEDFERDPTFSAVDNEVAAMIDCLKQPGLTHPLEAQSARATLEILIAIYESSRRRELIHLPLEVPDNPLFTMLDAGVV